MKFYTIRHGLTELNKKGIINGQIDEELSVEGMQQAKESIALLPKNLKRIYSSSLNRAKQTADIINMKLNLPISYHDELREVHLGQLAGKAWSTIKSSEELREKHLSVQYDYRAVGGESAQDVQNRVIQFLKGIAHKHTDNEALIVTHGGVIRILHLLEHGELLKDVSNASVHTFDTTKILGNIL